MFEEILARKSFYDKRIAYQAVDLEHKKAENQRIEQNKRDLQRYQVLCDRARTYLSTLKYIETAVTKEAKEFQTKRIDSLNEIITDAISRIFPDERVTAQLSCDFSRTDKVSLVLYNEHGDSFSPAMCNGKLMQYLISVSAVAAITKSLGYNAIFIDEAFGVARVDHLEDLGELLQSFVDSGLQTIVISQNPILYQNLRRREIHLETVDTGVERYAKIAKVEDL